MTLTLASDPWALAILIIISFLLAGALKGVIGMGLPTLAIGLLGMVMPTMEAAALLVIPAFVTNLWQYFDGRDARALLFRLWPMMLAQAIGVVIAWFLWRDANASALSIALGLVLLIYGLTGLKGVKIRVNPARESLTGVGLGWLSGMVTGVTGTLAIPAVMFLQALGLPKNQLVQAMGLSFSVSSLVLGIMLASNGLLAGNTGWLGMLALVAAALGMPIGRRLRGRMSDQAFRRLFFVVICIIGIALVIRNSL